MKMPFQESYITPVLNHIYYNFISYLSIYEILKIKAPLIHIFYINVNQALITLYSNDSQSKLVAIKWQQLNH